MTNSMRQLKQTILPALFLLVFQVFPAWAFSPAGPIGNNPNPAPGGFGNGDAWQTPSIGYPGLVNGDLTAPKNLGQEYRRNTPVMYYTFDESFNTFFNANGQTTNGTAAVEAAIAIFNNLSNLDLYSPQLTEFPLNSIKYNYTAQALGLTDLKSDTMSILMEQLGLTQPERYVWTLHDRFIPPGGTCPLDVLYNVVQRNFDPISQTYSSYVNGTLYTYRIDEICVATTFGVLAETVPTPVDLAADGYFSVAGRIRRAGGFYTGLTRDDVGGLRYLLSTNNILKEDPAAGSLWLSSTTNFNSITAYPPNPNSPEGFGTFDLGALISSSKTNDPATLQALFPGVIVASSTSTLAYTTNQTVVAYFTNFLGSQAGSPPVLIIGTNITYGYTTVFSDTFANVITNHYYSNSVVTLQTVTVGPLLGAEEPAPIVTNFASTTVTLPGVPSGDYYLAPTNACGLDILNTFFTNVLSFTNVSAIFGTNAPASTNASRTAFSFARTVVTLTNYVFSIHPITCAQIPNATGLYGGIGHIQFIRANFDSSFGNQFFQPITNTYTVLAVTNSQYQSRTFQRVVTGPDLIFSAEDLATANANILSIQNAEYVRDTPNWDQNNAGLGLAGPGTINPSTPTRVAFNDVGDVFVNGSLAAFSLATNQFLTEVDAVRSSPFFAWGSFDASTNPPIAYPSSANLTNLENQIVIQISPASLPNGTNGAFYPPTTFTTTGGSFTPPYQWSSTPIPFFTGSGLPAGLNLSTAGVLSGIPSGNASGIYFFVIQLTDVNGRSVSWNYSMVIQ